MNHKKERAIKAYIDWTGMPQPTLVGTLYAATLRGKEVFSFEYDKDWLNHECAFTLDPALQLFRGRQYADSEKTNFGVFLDSSPDRWGRFLMDRREAQIAREKGEKPRKLFETDYLLGVYDKHRMGAFRFKESEEGGFLDNNQTLATPPWTSLNELEQASLSLEKNDAEKDNNYSKWLTMLIAPGGSLGGARPKASVLDKRNHLWIAKFPSSNDQFNTGGWEMLAWRLAKKAGISLPEAKVKKLNNHHYTFLSKRFDRNDVGERIHFASAMTLLGRKDGDDASKGASYLEIAEFIIQQGANPEQDLEELWRRIVFFICISNVDDHLRNHGFTLEPSSGWKLSPAFDVNPDPISEGLKLNISEYDNAQDLTFAKEVIDYFRINSIKANKIIKHTVEVVKNWREEANKLKISQIEQNAMAHAFRVVEID